MSKGGKKRSRRNRRSKESKILKGKRNMKEGKREEAKGRVNGVN